MINSQYLQEDFVQDFSSSFLSRQSKKFENGSECKSQVFPVAVWPQFLKADAVNAVKTELSSMEFKLRSSDLYEFHQTADLKHVDAVKYPSIAAICSELYSPTFLNVMERVTGRKLGGHVDISGQRYQKGDFLLCHDDRLERRRIALILYLVAEEAGNEMRGGSLWAMRADEEGRPVAEHPQKITPKWNTLAFFEVTRYSLTCWFHDDESETDEEQSFDLRSEKPLNLFPIECMQEALNDIISRGLRVFRKCLKGQFVSSAQFTDCEPEWMRMLLCPEFAVAIEKHFGLQLDWPTRPVAYLLESDEGDFLIDTGLDRQGDFEYNYKDRSVTEAKQQRLSVTFTAEVDSSNAVSQSRPTMRLHFEPLEIQKITSPKLLIITMKFTIANQSLRSI